MKRLYCLCLVIALGLGWVWPSQASTPALAQLLSSPDGLASVRLPNDWYLASEELEGQTLLIAAPTADYASAWQQGGPMVVHLYLDSAPGLNEADLVKKTLKDYQLSGLSLESQSVTLWGLPAMHYQGQNERLQLALTILLLPESAGAIRLAITSAPDEWDADLYQAISASLVVLPQQTSTPLGWQSFIRAPVGWQQDEFSSFVQWIAPSDSPFSGTEIWFQVGSRGELVGQGEAGFVLRSLGVNYVSQVDESQSYPAVIGGLPANAQPFESFTHTGIAYNAIGGTDFGTANLVARAPLGQWTPAHQALVEAMVASVQIVPPSADSAPVGLAQGYRPPNFTGRYLDGSPFALDQYQGQLVLLHFWFVDCPSCRAEWPHLNAVYQEFKDQGLVLLAVNAIDSLEYIQAYMESEGLDFPIIQDNGQIHQLYNVSLFPTTYVITPDGVINQAARGPLSERSLRNLMARYLGG